MLGLVFVLLVCFLRRGLIGGAAGSGRGCSPRARTPPRPRRRRIAAAAPPLASVGPPRRRQETPFSGPVLEARGLTKSFGGLVANRDIDFAVEQGELRGIIGPNGAGKSTFFKMLTCELPPTAGRIIFHGRDITGMDVAARLPARPDQELSGQPALFPPDAARERRDRGAGRAARHLRARPAAPHRPGARARRRRSRARWRWSA